MSDRNLALEHIEGPRVYFPAPNHMIVRVPDIEKTRKGIILPGCGRTDDGAGGKLPPLGEVVCVGRITDEEWKGEEPEIGDTVLFHGNGLPIVALHDGLFLVPIAMVYLVVWQADGTQYEGEGFFWEPPLEVTGVME